MNAKKRRHPRRPPKADRSESGAAEHRPRRRWLTLLLVAVVTAIAVRIGISLFSRQLASSDSRDDESGELSRDEVPGASPVPPIALPNSATPLTVQQMHGELGDLAEEIVADYPRDAEAMLVAGMVYSELQRTQAAVTWLEKCVDEPTAREEAFVGLAKNLALLSEHDRAVNVLQQAIERSKVNETVVSRLAETLADAGRMEEATVTLRDAVQRYPRSAQLWLQLGQALVQEQAFAEAEPCVRRSIQLGNQDRSAMIALSTCLMRQGNREEALRIRQELAARTAGPADNTNDMTGVQQQETFQAGLNEKSRAASAQILSTAANVYGRHGDIETAQSLLLQSIALAPDEPTSYRALAEILYRSQRVGDAMVVVGRLTQLEPNIRQHYENLASMSAASGQFAQAEGLIEDTVQLHPDAGMPQFGMALILMAQQRYEAAREHAEAAAQRLQTADAYLLLLANLRALHDREAFQQAHQQARRAAPHDARLQNIHF